MEILSINMLWTLDVFLRHLLLPVKNENEDDDHDDKYDERWEDGGKDNHALWRTVCEGKNIFCEFHTFKDCLYIYGQRNPFKACFHAFHLSQYIIVKLFVEQCEKKKSF